MKKFFNILFIFFCVFGSSILLADEKINLKNIHKLLQEKKFEESIQNLEILSDQNDINSQILYSKILLKNPLKIFSLSTRLSRVIFRNVLVTLFKFI